MLIWQFPNPVSMYLYLYKINYIPQVKEASEIKLIRNSLLHMNQLKQIEMYIHGVAIITRLTQ